MLGFSFQLRTLVVCHCFRADEAVIRIFSARKANHPINLYLRDCALKAKKLNLKWVS